MFNQYLYQFILQTIKMLLINLSISRSQIELFQLHLRFTIPTYLSYNINWNISQFNWKNAYNGLLVITKVIITSYFALNVKNNEFSNRQIPNSFTKNNPKFLQASERTFRDKYKCFTFLCREQFFPDQRQHVLTPALKQNQITFFYRMLNIFVRSFDLN